VATEVDAKQARKPPRAPLRAAELSGARCIETISVGGVRRCGHSQGLPLLSDLVDTPLKRSLWPRVGYARYFRETTSFLVAGYAISMAARVVA
jgi:hypothetical protein